jgi:hypothetical protein
VNGAEPLHSAAESAANLANSAPIDAELAAIVDAWPTLPATTRRTIVGLIEQATAEDFADDQR